MNEINKAKILVSNTMKKIFDICGKHAKLLHQIFSGISQHFKIAFAKKIFR